MAAIDGSPVNGYPVLQTFATSYHAEQDKVYRESIPNGDGADHWFWLRLQPTESTTAVGNFPVSLKNFSTTSGNFSMKIDLRGETSLAHHTKVYVNGTAVKDILWSGQVELTQDIADISPALFINGYNTIKVEEILDSGTSFDRVYVNWFEVNYTDTYVAESDVLKCQGTGTGGTGFQIKNFSNATIWAFDVTDPVNVSRIQNPQITASGNSYVLKFEDSLSGTKTYYALTAGSFTSPAEIVLDEPSNLQSPRTDVDYIIITHESFYDAIQQLKDYRASRGLGVEVVKIQDIYDEFSCGLKDARAIKDFLSYAYTNWNSNGYPTYVLLVGDASIDYRDDSGNFANGNVDFVPTYLYQTDNLGDTPTDNWYVCVSGTDPIPDMIIGRMSVKTADDVTNIIDKVIEYEAEAAGDWSSRVILAADNGFESASDKLAALLPASFTPEKVYLSTYPAVEQATTDLVNKINAGSLLTNYTGHGSTDNWSGEFLFHTPDDKDADPRNDVDRLTNEHGLTFVVTLDCLNGFFPNFLDKYCLAEEFVRAQKKGAIACLAPTDVGYPTDHDALAEKLFNRLFTDPDRDNIAGSAVYTAKINAYAQQTSPDILDAFTFFGDPATELKISSPSQTTTTTTVPGGLCPATTAFGKGSPQLMTVYALRDNVLSKTPAGRTQVIAYYEHAPEISAIFASRPELKAKAQLLMLRLLPAFGSMIAQRNTKISRDTLQSGISFIDSLSRFAGPALKRDLMELKTDIQRGALLKQFGVAVQ